MVRGVGSIIAIAAIGCNAVSGVDDLRFDGTGGFPPTGGAADGGGGGWSTCGGGARCADAGTPVLETTYLGMALLAEDTATYTFGATDLGEPARDRLIVAAVGYGAYSPAPSMTGLAVAGVAAEQVIPRSGDTSAFEVWAALVPDGTIGTVDIQMDQPAAGCSLAVYRLVGYADPVPFDTIANNDGFVASGDIDVPENGTVIAYAMNTDNFAGSCAWQGITERFDHDMGGLLLISSAMDTGLSMQTLTITATPDAGSRLTRMSAASWR